MTNPILARGHKIKVLTEPVVVSASSPAANLDKNAAKVDAIDKIFEAMGYMAEAAKAISESIEE